MRSWVFVLAIASAGLGTAVEAADLDGSWTAVRAERDGASVAALVEHRLHIAAGRFVIDGANGSQLYAGRYQVNTAVEPTQIDFVNETGEAAGVTWEGIYRLADGELTIVDDAPDPSAPRPASFEAGEGSGYVLVLFRR